MYHKSVDDSVTIIEDLVFNFFVASFTQNKIHSYDYLNFDCKKKHIYMWETILIVMQS